MDRSNFWPIFLIVATAGTGLLIGVGGSSPVHLVIVIGYLLICPGMAFVRLLRLHDPLAEFVLALAASISIDLILAETMVLLRIWSPVAGFFGLAVFCLAGAFLQYSMPVGESERR